MIKRTIYKEIKEAIKHYPVIVLTGARQVGKTTIAQMLVEEYGYNYVDLTNRIDREQAISDPSYFIENHPYPLIIDEIQYAPDLIEVIETIVNEKRRKREDINGSFVLTGSQQFKIMQGVSESMAGRAAIFKIEPLSLSEVMQTEERIFIPSYDRVRYKHNDISVQEVFDMIVYGFYPELHRNKQNKDLFYSSYVNTYIERDVKQLLEIRNENKFLNFMQLLASLTSQQLNINNISKIVGVDNKTIDKWLSVLISTGIVYLLRPYSDSSLTKRLVKSSKLYFSDTGLAAYLAMIIDGKSLEPSIYAGPFFENFIMNEIRKSYINNGKEFTGTYYRDSENNEVDLVLLLNGELHLVEIKKGIEFKADAIKGFKALQKGRYPIGYSCLICNTKQIYPLTKDIEVIPLSIL